MERKIKIAIVDDNTKIAGQLQERLSLAENVEIIFYSERGKEALNLLKTTFTLPDIILMDIEMPEMDGIETTMKIKAEFPEIKIIMLTVFDHEEAIFKSIQAGANGYFLKDEKLSRMLNAFEEVMEGCAPMSPAIAQKALQLLVNGYKPAEKREYESHQTNLSARELEILELIAQGHKNQVIADKLFISFFTVKKHIENVYSKLQLHSRVELVNWYNKN